jgi:hypothetical protein
MPRRDIETIRHAIALAERVGVTVEQQRSADHPQLVFRHAGCTRVITFPGSASNRRTHLNMIADVKRTLRELLGGGDPFAKRRSATLARTQTIGASAMQKRRLSNERAATPPAPADGASPWAALAAWRPPAAPARPTPPLPRYRVAVTPRQLRRRQYVAGIAATSVKLSPARENALVFDHFDDALHALIDTARLMRCVDIRISVTPLPKPAA